MERNENKITARNIIVHKAFRGYRIELRQNVT